MRRCITRFIRRRCRKKIRGKLKSRTDHWPVRDFNFPRILNTTHWVYWIKKIPITILHGVQKPITIQSRFYLGLRPWSFRNEAVSTHVACHLSKWRWMSSKACLLAAYPPLSPPVLVPSQGVCAQLFLTRKHQHDHIHRWCGDVTRTEFLKQEFISTTFSSWAYLHRFPTCLSECSAQPQPWPLPECQCWQRDMCYRNQVTWHMHIHLLPTLKFEGRDGEAGARFWFWFWILVLSLVLILV